MKSKIPAITIGLDLGDKKHAICILNHAGEIVEERSITKSLLRSAGMDDRLKRRLT